MAILAFQKPDKVVMLESTEKFGKFEFRPLEPGFGVTIGNALRRILLSSLEGYAVNTVRIAGVEHEFSSVPGVKEDVTNIILNLKQVRFKQVVEEFENEKVSITVENSTEFKAGDIGKYLTGFEVLNPDLVICHLDSKASMQIDLTINKGRGYVPADENREFCTDVNVLPIDSIYTPIRNVKYAVEPYRVEQKTDYDKLVLEVTTDGSISPKDALKEAAKILIYHFMLFSDEKITLENTDVDGNQEFDEEVLHMRQLLKTRLVDMNLSVRALNCLKAADVETLGDLVQYNKTDLLKFRNFGKKSLTELDDLLESLNLSFSRTASHRHAMLANMAISLIMHKRITTTLAKAKALKKYVEPLITRCKDDSTHSRRVVFSHLQNKEAIKELFGPVAAKVGDRPGGYTRIIKLGFRSGDAAQICFIELVDFDENMAKTEGKKKATRRSRRSKAAAAPAEGAAEAAATEATVAEAPAAEVAAEPAAEAEAKGEATKAE